jgi:tetratricopeptide (TPR) repeat protein
MSDEDQYAHTPADDLVADNHFKEGLERCSYQDYKRAIEHFTVAIYIQPHNAALYYARGNAYRLQDDLKRALEDYDAALRFDPQLADAYLRRSELRKQYADYDGAAADLEKYLDLCDGTRADGAEDRALIQQTIRDLKERAGES